MGRFRNEVSWGRVFLFVGRVGLGRRWGVGEKGVLYVGFWFVGGLDFRGG